MRAKSFFFKLRIVLSVDVCCSQHYIDVIGCERGRTLRPIVADLERNLESFLAVNGVWLRVEPAVRHQSADATNPHVDAHTDLGIPGCRTCWQQQWLGRVDCVA